MKNKSKGSSRWLVLGVIVLVVLLFIWIFFAEASGDTDVNANFTQIFANSMNIA